MNEFKTAVQAQKLCTRYERELSIYYNPDLIKLLDNIKAMITDLSKLEVVARQSRQMYKVDDKIKEIQQAFDYLEKMLLLAKLMI